MSVNDFKKALTAEDVIRRYNLNNLSSDRKKIKQATETLVKTDKELKSFIDATAKDIENIQSQVDGNITTWFLIGVPTIENQPANEWLTDKDKNNHLGDLYYDQDTGYAYRFALENNEYKWVKIVDSDVTEALAIANSAKDTADSKRRVFVVSPTPPYDVGDIWIKDDKDLYRCRAKRADGDYNAVDWVLATDYSNDDYAKEVEAVLNQFKTTVEKDYVTYVKLETTKESIESSVSSVTTKVEKIENDVGDVISTVTSQNEKISKITQTTDEINSKISDIADITTSGESDYASVNLVKVNESEPIAIKIHPTTEDISYLYPSDYLYPADDLYLNNRIIRFTNINTNEVVDYELPDDLLYYDDNNYDEFILNYDSQTCSIIKRVEYIKETNKNAVKTTEEIINYDYPTIALTAGNYTISLPGYSSAYLYIQLMASNIYTTQFATKVELNSEISQTKDDINLKVSQLNGKDTQLQSEIDVQESQIVLKVDSNGKIVKATLTADPKDGTAFAIGADNIDLTANDIINLLANNTINLTSKNIVIDSTNFKVDKDGNLICNNANVNGILEKTTTLGTVKIGKGSAGLIEMEATQNGIAYKSRYNVAGMRYFINGNEKVKISALNNGSISLKDNSGNDLVVLDTANGGYLALNNKNNSTTIDLIGETGKIICASLTQTSLAENKKNFEKYDGALNEINKIDVYKYNLKSEKNGTKKHLGFVIGDEYNYSKLITSEKNDGVDIYSMTSLCLQAIKEQQVIINELKEEIKILKRKG